jgi:hypothetical protein
MNRNDTRSYWHRQRADAIDGAWEECNFCGYPAPLHNANVRFTPHGLVEREDEPEWLCCLCSNIVMSQTPEVAEVQKTICNVANAILATLKGEV